MTSYPADGISRRAVLVAFAAGAGAAGLSAILAPVATGADPLAGRPSRVPGGPLTVASWRASRSRQLYVAHRGSGDVLPEHSMEAYQAAFDWGATCMEVSVAITSDGVLICMHDDTYDRTTTGRGEIVAQPSSVLADIRIWQPQLGEAWTENPPKVPLFEDVLRTFGAKVILCVEAKVPAAYEPMMSLVEKYGLRDSVIVKGSYNNTQLYRAQTAGYPIFSYFGTAGDVTLDAINQLGARLHPERDILVIAGIASAPSFISDELVKAAVATGVPVWVHPLHRRSDAAHFFALGVDGAICASYGYIAGATTSVKADSWAARRIAPGEITKSPASQSYAPTFTADGQLVLDAKGTQHFVTLGQFGPLPAAAASYTIDADVSWLGEPDADTDNVTLAFGHEDDRYYEHRQGDGTGYHLILRRNGELGFYLHKDGVSDGVLLAPSVSTKAPAIGKWAHLRVEVSPDRIVASRTDVAGATVTATDSTVRGGYLHIGRSSLNGSAAFRALAVS